MSQGVAVWRAFVFLQAMSIRNLVTHRLKRLRQPKYLFGAIAGIGYFYFIFFRRGAMGDWHGGQPRVALGWAQQPGVMTVVIALAALLLLVIVVGAWVVPTKRAALTFSQAEVAFLFPAPLTRRMLIHYKLLRAQLGILLSAFLFTLISHRASMFGGNPVWHAAGWWLLLSTIRLHFIGASFWRDVLLELGMPVWLRRLLVTGVVLALLVATGAWMKSRLSLPTNADLGSLQAFTAYLSGFLSTPPLAWVLLPFQWMVAPVFAVDAHAFLRAAPAAVLVLLLHYAWVVRSDTSFEDASIDASRRRASKVARMRAGKSAFDRQPTKPRTAPFALAPTGFVPVAFLWKNLIALGPFYRLRSWLIACAVVVAGGLWMAARPQFQPALLAIGGIALMLAGWLLVVGPMFMQRSLGRMFLHLDVLKASPLSGRQIVLGELLTPLTLMTLVQWLALLVAAMAFVGPAFTGHASTGQATGSVFDLALLTPANIMVALLCVALLAPMLCGLMLCVPFAGMLVFPGWLAGSHSRGGGVEVMGQRIIFFAGYVLVLSVAVLPAAIVGGSAFLAGQWLTGLVLALPLATLLGGAVLLGELWLAVAWLGRRAERLDLSREQLQ